MRLFETSEPEWHTDLVDWDSFGGIGNNRMIDWIHQRCKEWGHQLRRINYGNDGWPPRTILDKMIKEGILGAASGRFCQHFPECLGEEELKINNAVEALIGAGSGRCCSYGVRGAMRAQNDHAALRNLAYPVLRFGR